MTLPTLPTRPLGLSGLQITTVGFGSWAVGSGWIGGRGPQGDSRSIAAMRHALDLGVNWIDAAAMDWLGQSEEVVGSLLRELPADARPYIFTKCGPIGDRNNRVGDAGPVSAPDSIRQNCEASLLRLGIQQIDLYQVHWPYETGVAVEDSWATMAKLVEEGKVRAVGVSNFPVDLLERCEEIRHVDALQPTFSLINRAAAANEIPWCDDHRSGVICWSASNDWRRDAAALNPPNHVHNLALQDALRLIARRHDTSVSCVAIAWTLSWPGVTAAIVGSRSPEQVDGWIGAASLELTQTDLGEIASVIVRTNTGIGPSDPSRMEAELEIKVRTVETRSMEFSKCGSN